MARKLSGLETALEACEFFDAPKIDAVSRNTEEGRENPIPFMSQSHPKMVSIFKNSLLTLCRSEKIH